MVEEDPEIGGEAKGYAVLARELETDASLMDADVELSILLGCIGERGIFWYLKLNQDASIKVTSYCLCARWRDSLGRSEKAHAGIGCQ